MVPGEAREECRQVGTREQGAVWSLYHLEWLAWCSLQNRRLLRNVCLCKQTEGISCSQAGKKGRRPGEPRGPGGMMVATSH